MALRFDPFREFDRLAEQMFATAAGAGAVPRAMPMDVYRSGEHYVLHCDLPGIDPGSLNIDVEGTVLSIEAHRDVKAANGSEKDTGIQWLANERISGKFRRQLTLGDDVDTENIRATYDNGVVTITLPISERAKPRRIEITSAGQQERTLEGTVVNHR